MDAQEIDLVAGIDLESAVRALRARAQPDVDDAITDLRRVHVFTQSLCILDQYQAPELRLPARINTDEIHAIIAHDNYVSPIEETALLAVSTHFPLWTDQIAEEIINLEPGQAAPHLVIEPQGMTFGFDDFEYMLQEISDFPKRSSLLWFCKLLDSQVDQGTYFEAAQHFGWPEDRLPKTMTTGNYFAVNGDRLINMLHKQGLPEIATLFQVAWGATDNPFFDYSEEQCYVEAGLYNLENVNRMANIWDDAANIRRHIELAETMPERRPGIYDQILDIWDRCIIYERKKKPKTLMDLWADDMIPDRPPRVIDEFYGPLDGQDDEEDQ